MNDELMCRGMALTDTGSGTLKQLAGMTTASASGGQETLTENTPQCIRPID